MNRTGVLTIHAAIHLPFIHSYSFTHTHSFIQTQMLVRADLQQALCKDILSARAGTISVLSPDESPGPSAVPGTQ